MSSSTPQSSGGKVLRAAAVSLLVGLVIGGIALYYVGFQQGQNAELAAQPKTVTSVLIPSGTVYPLNAGQYEKIQIKVNNSVAISGKFAATNGVTFYIMTPAEFSNFSSSGTAGSYLYTTGNVVSAPINTNISSGTFYLIFQNSDSFTTSSVTITQDIDATG